jgi:hypothetical protein
MRKLLTMLAVTGLLLAPGLPVSAEPPVVWVNKEHDSVWGFSFTHINPCTNGLATVEWEAEHRNMMVDHDRDGSTLGDRHISGGVMNLLWATHSDPGWEVIDVGDKFTQQGWDGVVWFGDEDQATVIWTFWLRASNPATGQSYQSRHNLRWVANANGEVIRGQGSQTNHRTPCRGK